MTRVLKFSFPNLTFALNRNANSFRRCSNKEKPPDAPSSEKPLSDTRSSDEPPSGALASDKTKAGTLPSDKTPVGVLPPDKIPSGALSSDETPAGALPSDKTPAGALPPEEPLPEAPRPVASPLDGDVGFPEAPQECCMSGCANCVWLDYAEQLSKHYSDGGEQAMKKIIKEVDDLNVRAYLLFELRMRMKKNEEDREK